LHSSATNNIRLVASLLASPFILSLFAIRFAHRRGQVKKGTSKRAEDSDVMFGLGVTSGPEDYGVFDEDNYSDRDLGVFVDNEFVEKEEEWGGEVRPSEE